MISDLPHVMYHPPKGATKEEEENRMVIMRDMQNKIKKGGLHSISGLNLNFAKDKVINGNELIERLKRK